MKPLASALLTYLFPSIEPDFGYAIELIETASGKAGRIRETATRTEGYHFVSIYEAGEVKRVYHRIPVCRGRGIF